MAAAPVAATGRALINHFIARLPILCSPSYLTDVGPFPACSADELPRQSQRPLVVRCVERLGPPLLTLRSRPAPRSRVHQSQPGEVARPGTPGPGQGPPGSGCPGWSTRSTNEQGVCWCRDRERVAGRGVDLDALEGVAESAAQRQEGISRTALVVAEPEPSTHSPFWARSLMVLHSTGSSPSVVHLRALSGAGRTGCSRRRR